MHSSLSTSEDTITGGCNLSPEMTTDSDTEDDPPQILEKETLSNIVPPEPPPPLEHMESKCARQILETLRCGPVPRTGGLEKSKREWDPAKHSQSKSMCGFGTQDSRRMRVHGMLLILTARTEDILSDHSVNPMEVFVNRKWLDAGYVSVPLSLLLICAHVCTAWFTSGLSAKCTGRRTRALVAMWR